MSAYLCQRISSQSHFQWREILNVPPKTPRIPPAPNPRPIPVNNDSRAQGALWNEDISDIETVPTTSEYEISLGSLPRGLYVAFERAFTRSSGSPNASHNFPTCDLGKSCLGFFGSVFGILAGRWLPGSSEEPGSRGLSDIAIILPSSTRYNLSDPRQYQVAD